MQSVLHFSQAPGGVAGLTQSACHKNLRFQLDEKQKPHRFSQASDRGEAKRRGKWFLCIVLVKNQFFTSSFPSANSASGLFDQSWRWPQHMLHLPYGNGARAAPRCCSSPLAHTEVQADTCLTPAPPPNFLHTTAHSCDTAALQISWSNATHNSS